MTEKITSIVPKKEAINPHESFESFLEDIRTEYGEEFVLTVIGISKDKYQEMTPFGVNYEKNIREFVRKYPSFSRKLKQDYEEGTGKAHRLIEKALAQNEYLDRAYEGKERKTTDLSLAEEKRVYYDPDGYPNLQVDPTFYKFYIEKVSSGIVKKSEILSQFSREFPEKANAYKIPLGNRERWDFKETKSERLSEIINEQGVETLASTIDCNGIKVETVVFNQPSSSERRVRVYRGVVSADQTILRQSPYGARGLIEYRDPSPESSHNYITSTIQEVPNIEEEINEMARNPSMEVILRYAEKMRKYFQENNMSKELEYLEATIIKFSEAVMEGTSLEAMLALEQVSGGMYTAQYLMAPFVSATPNLGEAWTYGRGGVIVYDIPESELKNLSTRSECMINGVVDEKYISMFIFNNPNISDAKQIENALQSSANTQLYAREEIDEVGSNIKKRREAQEEINNPENRKIAIRILIENYINKYPIANLNVEDFLSDLNNIDYSDTKAAQREFQNIEQKISQKYLEYIYEISTIFDISPNIIKKQTEYEDANLKNIVTNFFERFKNKEEFVNDILSETLPELKIDFKMVVEKSIKNKTNINIEIYSIIAEYCKSNQVSVPKRIEDIFGGYEK